MTTQEAPNDQRRFSRVLFNASAQLKVDDRELACQIHDLSLKGALLDLPGSPTAADLTLDSACTLEFSLAADDRRIRMLGTVSHVEGSSVGLRCESIDLDSVSHLRRLVELNVGDETILMRDLSAMIAGH